MRTLTEWSHNLRPVYFMKYGKRVRPVAMRGLGAVR